jgi:hypothetical protein
MTLPVLNACLALLGVVALILLAARLARSRLPALRTCPATHLKLTDTLALDPTRRLHLLDCDGCRVLLLTGGGSDVMLPLGRAE